MSDLQRVPEDESAPVRTLLSPSHLFSFIILSALVSTGLGVAGSTLLFASGSLVFCIGVGVVSFVAALTIFVIHSRKRARRVDAVMAGYRPDPPLEGPVVAELAELAEAAEEEEPRWQHASIRNAMARRRKKREQQKKTVARKARENSDTNFLKMFSYFRSGYVGAAAPVGSALMVGGGLYLSSIQSTAATAMALGALMATLFGLGLLVFYGISVFDAWRLRRANRSSDNENI